MNRFYIFEFQIRRGRNITYKEFSINLKLKSGFKFEMTLVIFHETNFFLLIKS